MESCVATERKTGEPVEVWDIRRNLLDDFGSVHAEENLQVFLRVRPFTAAESVESQDCVTIEGPDAVVLKAPRSCQSNRANEKPVSHTAQRFTFTQVFGPEAGQRAVFDGSVRSRLRHVLQGGNCLVFTYGVTNAGKTFTFLGPDHDSGLLPRSLSAIFSSVEGRLYDGGDLKPLRCRDFTRLTAEQQAAENYSKKQLLSMLKEGNKASGRTTFLEGSSVCSDNSISEADSLHLDPYTTVRYSIWVSFCEIYNENIHDLLEQSSAGQKRTVLRLSQDVKGNSFIKDLRWVEVNSFEEAYRVLKIGRKNQSFSCTRLNQESSRSHSIFSVRILRVDDSGAPRVLGISELALCDLAGSERCSRTKNTGNRLKEAGNINTSLLTLGKCLHAMRMKQQTKFQHHVPFRESKLTHFLQFFFCGAGRVSMVVNINQSSSCYDETLNVLKFSALAQKVVVLNNQPVNMDDTTRHRPAMELSILIDEVNQHPGGRGRKSSLVAWETSLEDVQEDGEEEEDEDEESMMEVTVLEEREENQNLANQQAALRLVLESKIREEVGAEFAVLFSKMENDYRERLEKEREILEERADRRLEILQKLVASSNQIKEEQPATMRQMFQQMSEDLKEIKEDAQTVHLCLTADSPAPVTMDENITGEQDTLTKEEENTWRDLEEGFSRFIQEKKNSVQDERTWLDDERTRLEEEKTRLEKDRTWLEDERTKLEEEKTRLEKDRTRLEDERTRLEEEKTGLREERTRVDDERTRLEEEKTGLREERTRVDDERTKLEEEKNKLEEEKTRLEKERTRVEDEKTELEKERTKLEEERTKLEDEKTGLEKERTKLEEERTKLEEEKTGLEKERTRLQEEGSTGDEGMNLDSLLSSLESKQRETNRLEKEKKALVNGIFQLQTQVTSLKAELKQQTDISNSLSEQLNAAKPHLQIPEHQSEEENSSVCSPNQEEKKQDGPSVFHSVMAELQNQSEAALQRSAHKSQQIQDLQRDKKELEDELVRREERANQRAEFCSEGGAELEQKMIEDLQQENQESREREQKPQRKETQEVSVSPSNKKKIQRTEGRKRKICHLEDLTSNEKKRTKPKEKDPMFSENVSDRISSSTDDNSMCEKTVAAVSGPKRGRKKLFKSSVSSPLLCSPNESFRVAKEEKESHHSAIRRQLRSHRK